MLQLKNNSPFEAQIALFPDQNGIDTLYTTVKATFTLGEKIEVAEKQSPIVVADEYRGDPLQTSLKYASEVHLTKPSTDIVMIGDACAPGKRPVSQLDVSLSVAGQKKTVRVMGDRRWDSGLLGLKMTPPLPFTSMPLIYEKAYGGSHEVDKEKQIKLFEARNPIGIGFKGKRKSKELKGMSLPNLENPVKLIAKPDDRPTPACFSFISSSWQPRVSFVGTYDEAWTKKRAPYLAEDFDSRFFHTVYPDQVSKKYLKGGEPVFIQGMSPDGVLQFPLPLCEIEASVQIAGKKENPPLNLETVLFEPDDSRFSLLFRSATTCDKKALKVEQVDINLNNLQLNGGRA
ncbi:MAG: DUF2169 domain-containing protein [Nitrospinota bacterium]